MSNVRMRWSNVNTESIMVDSPYQIYPGEIMKKIIPDNPRRLNLSSLQAEIVLATNQLLVVTSRLLTKYLNIKGIEVEQKKVQKQIAYLADNNYLNKFLFCNPDKGIQASYKVYTVGHKGKGFLYSTYNIQTQKVGFLEQCNVAQIKRILASNQLLIDTKLVSRMDFSVAKMVTDDGFHLLKNKKLFRSIGFCQNDDCIKIIEPVRQESTYEKDVMDKLKRIEKTLSSKKCNIDVNKRITVILMAESYGRMENIMNLVNEKQYKCFDIVYTYDTLIACDEKNKFFKKCSDMENVEQLVAV